MTADGKEIVPNAVKKGQVLIVCTSCPRTSSDKPTGAWLSEFSVPYYEFQKAGYDVTLASINGGEIPMDPTSNHPLKDAEASRFMEDEAAQQQLHHSVPISAIEQPASYDAIFLAGGHGAIYDMPSSTKLKSIVEEMWAAGKIVSTICHGPAGLVNVVDRATGKPLVSGKTMACFSDMEEKAADLMGKSVPFQGDSKDGIVLTVQPSNRRAPVATGPKLGTLKWVRLESKLRELGANVSVGLPMVPCVHCDGRLITGQNPTSVHKLVQLVIQALDEMTAGRHPTSTA